MTKAVRDVAPFGPCKLCATPAKLQRSHVMPRWSYRRTTQGEGGDPNPIFIADGIARQGGKQLAAHLLCRPCEERIGRWESYVAAIALTPDGRFPALAKVRRVRETITTVPRGDASALDLDKIVRFALSVVWRATVCDLEDLDEVHLGTPHTETIADYLRGPESAALPDTVFVLVDLIAPEQDLPIDRMILPPFGCANPQGGVVYRFALFGIVFDVFAGSLLPATYDLACTARTKRVVLSAGERLLRPIADLVLGAKAVGGLREDED